LESRTSLTDFVFNALILSVGDRPSVITG